MYDVREVQSEWYAKRIGQIYGDYKVIAVEYDETKRKQKWTLQCRKCGLIRTTYNHHDYVKGRNSAICRNCREIEKIRLKPKSFVERKMEMYSEHIGEKHGSWEIIDAKVGMGFLTRCTVCGTERWRGFSETLNHDTDECKCKNRMLKAGMDMIGMRFGHLVVVDYEPGRNKGCKCRCDCGNEIYVKMSRLKRGGYSTCGEKCRYHQEEQRAMNGESSTRLYRIWRGMKERCYNPESYGYRLYGMRGITICDEWREDFFAFKEWAVNNGYRDDLSIDRINGDGNYEPSNCRWATAKEQAENSRPPFTFIRTDQSKLTLYFIDGVGKTKEDWYKIYDTSSPAVGYRMKHWNMTFEQALKFKKNKNGRPRKAKS